MLERGDHALLVVGDRRDSEHSTRRAGDLARAFDDVAAQLSPAEREAVRSQVIERARKVAQSAGGILGIGAISDAEKRVLASLERPFA